MSTLKVNNIGKTSGSTQDTMQGLARSWYAIDGSGTASVLDSLNTTSFVDNGQGDFTVTRTTAFDSTSYAVGSQSDFDGSDSRVVTVTSYHSQTARTTTVMRHALQDTSANGHDPDNFSAILLGDLA